MGVGSEGRGRGNRGKGSPIGNAFSGSHQVQLSSIRESVELLRRSTDGRQTMIREMRTKTRGSCRPGAAEVGIAVKARHERRRTASSLSFEVCLLMHLSFRLCFQPRSLTLFRHSKMNRLMARLASYVPILMRRVCLPSSTSFTSSANMTHS